MAKALNILFAEDDSYFRNHLARRLSSYGKVAQAPDLATARGLIDAHLFHVAFVDLGLGPDNLEGLEVLNLCREKGIVAVVVSAHTSKNIVTKAYQKGCHYYFAKEDFEEQLDERLGGLLAQMKQSDFADKMAKEFVTFDRHLLATLKRIGQRPPGREQNVLITGATGVGKSKVAKLIHSLDNKERPFVHLNITELPENLVESELFGHKKGAFTGAINDKVGLLKLAHGGTLFLDEIGVTPLYLQKKLLKVIEQKRFCPVGSTEVIESNFRLISATCDDLPKLIAAGEFRIDFYFRIKGLEIPIPELARRRQDILPLIDHFIAKSPQKIALDQEAQDILQSYPWPGNVRELENLIGELICTSQGIIGPQDLPRHIREGTGFSPRPAEFLTGQMRDMLAKSGLGPLVRQVEQQALKWALKQSGGRINEAARALGISKTVFYRVQRSQT